MHRHETDSISLACGAVFVFVGALFLWGGIDAGDFVRMWALPVALIASGAVLGALGLARHRRHQLERYEELANGDEESHPALW